MKYAPSECPKRGSGLVRSAAGGRPTRWCSEGCKRSGEGEMSRLSSLLRTLEGDRVLDRLNGYHRPVCVTGDIMAELQSRYDHLARVPERAELGVAAEL
jgi:hypothetical protein